MFRGQGEKESALLPYYGMELEMEFVSDNDNPDQLQKVARKIPANWYCKLDGSLRYGLEFVSHPHSWQRWLTESWAWIPKGAAAFRTSSCGMHIHVSRSAISALHLWKLLTFFSRNERYVFRFSRRQSARFNQWSAIDQERWLINSKAKGNQGDSRYRAINTYPDHTIEFRIFRGTCNAKRIMENLAWTVAMVEFTRRASVRELGVPQFARFIESREGTAILTDKYSDIVRERNMQCA